MVSFVGLGLLERVLVVLSDESAVEYLQAGDGLKTGRCVERQRWGIVGLGLQRYTGRAGGAGDLDDVPKQPARDAAAAVLRYDVEITDRPGGAEHQRRRHDRARDEPASVVGSHRSRQREVVLCHLVAKPAASRLRGWWSAVMHPVVIEQDSYLVEIAVGRRYRHDCDGHGIQSRRR